MTSWSQINDNRRKCKMSRSSFNLYLISCCLRDVFTADIVLRTSIRNIAGDDACTYCPRERDFICKHSFWTKTLEICLWGAIWVSEDRINSLFAFEHFASGSKSASKIKIVINADWWWVMIWSWYVSSSEFGCICWKRESRLQQTEHQMMKDYIF